LTNSLLATMRWYNVKFAIFTSCELCFYKIYNINFTLKYFQSYTVFNYLATTTHTPYYKWNIFTSTRKPLHQSTPKLWLHVNTHIKWVPFFIVTWLTSQTSWQDNTGCQTWSQDRTQERRTENTEFIFFIFLEKINMFCK